MGCGINTDCGQIGEKMKLEWLTRGKMMKKLVLAVLALIGSAGICSTAYGSIALSAHDFRLSGWADGQICLPCHAPHNGTIIDDAPLWNHTVSAATYDLYSSTTLDATLSQPVGVSKLCLSCHDGTIAVDSYTGHTGTIDIGTLGTGSGDIGTELGNDHPVSFTYDAALATADGGLFDPTTRSSLVSDLGGTIDTDMLFANRMECSSCHDVHNKYTNDSLLLIDNAGSALCLTCHDK